MMMCKCCEGSKADCKCMHHMVPMLGGLLLVVLGVLLYLTNYGWVSADVWKCILPAALIIAGIWHACCCGIKRMEQCKMGKCKTDDCKDDKCCTTDGGKHEGDMKK